MAGIDFGNLNCCLAVARNKGIEIVDNDYSLQATPSCVSFGQFARLMGYGAKQQLNVNYRNSVVNFKHLLGRNFSDPVVQAFRPHIPCDFVVQQFPNDQIGIKVTHLGAARVFSPEQVVGCLLTHLRLLLTRSMGADVTECVINVPFFYDDSQRMALLKAGRIAGLSLRLVSEPAAIAYCYGMYKGSGLPPLDQPSKLVAFVDAGHSSVQACVVAFNTGKAEILGATYDLSVGGLHFDSLLRNYFWDDFRKRFKIDAKQNARAWLRLLDECEKLKKQMSANSQKIPFAIECFMNDVDVNGSMQRAEFEQMAEPLFQKIPVLLQQLMASSKVKVEDISDVELVGGSSRVPRIKQIVAEFFKREPKTTMNQDDTVARGCALRSALLYPVYQMKQFTMIDPYDMAVDPSKLPSDEQLTDEISAEQEMQAADLRDKQRSDSKNALEEYCFKVQHAMEDEQLCQDKLTHEERHNCIGQCNAVLEWLDSESETLQRKQIECRHEELEKYCQPLMSKLYAVAELNKDNEMVVTPQQNGSTKMETDSSPQQQQKQNATKKPSNSPTKKAQPKAKDGGPIIEEPVD